MHLEINNWGHVLNLLYWECLQRNVIINLVNVLILPISKGGCGLKSVAINIQEHFKMEKTRHTKLSNRIGAQAIKLSKYGLRIVDILEVDSESDLQVYRRCGISKIFETLRTVGFLMKHYKHLPKGS